MERGGLVRPGDMKGSGAGGAHEEGDDDDDDQSGAAVKSRNRLARQSNFQGETNVIDVDKHMMAYIEEEMKKLGVGKIGIKAILQSPEFDGFEQFGHPFGLILHYCFTFIVMVRRFFLLLCSSANSSDYSSQHSYRPVQFCIRRHLRQR